MTGASIGASSCGFDAATIAYSNNGMPLWTNRYLGLQDGSSTVADMVFDGFGNIVVAGISSGPGSSHDFLTVKYSSAGIALWTNRHNGLGNGPDEARALVVNDAGNVYVTGNSARNSDYPFNYDYLTIAYSSDGLPLWTNHYSGTGNYDDYPRAIAVSGNGNVIVTGHSFKIGTGNEFATVAYSGAGVPLWANRHSGSGEGGDGAFAIGIDGNGDVVVVGYTVGSGAGVSDYTTIKYSSAGAHLWTRYYNGPGNSYDQAYAVAIDSSNNVFTAGFSYGTGFTRDYATIKYSAAGTPLWTNRYSGPGARTRPGWVAEVLAHWLRRRMALIQRQKPAGEEPSWGELFNHDDFGWEDFHTGATKAPAEFVRHVLPVILEITDATIYSESKPPKRDAVWPILINSQHETCGCACRNALAGALDALAKSQPDKLGDAIQELRHRETYMANFFLLNLYAAGAVHFADTAAVLLCEQPWRFHCGYSDNG